MRISYRLVSAAAAVLSLTGVAAQAYDFENVADSSGEFEQFGLPRINTVRTVVFFAESDDGVEGIHTGQLGGGIATVADTTGPYLNLSGTPAINEAGRVAFFGDLDTGGRGIFTRAGAAGSVTTVADHNTPLGSFGTNLSISADGTVAFNASTGGPGTGGGVSGNGGPVTTVADRSGPFDSFPSNTTVISPTGTVVFIGDLDSSSTDRMAARTGLGPTSTVAETQGSSTTFFGALGINSAGAVVFASSTFPFGRGIFLGSSSRTPTTMIVDSDDMGPYSSFTDAAPGINSFGAIAFLARTNTGAEGIFTGDDPVADKVIAVGETLFGGVVTELAFGRGLNDNGDVAFFYTLNDGRQGVAVAVVPEPAGFAVVALGSLVLRRRGRLAIAPVSSCRRR